MPSTRQASDPTHAPRTIAILHDSEQVARTITPLVLEDRQQGCVAFWNNKEVSVASSHCLPGSRPCLRAGRFIAFAEKWPLINFDDLKLQSRWGCARPHVRNPSVCALAETRYEDANPIGWGDDFALLIAA